MARASGSVLTDCLMGNKTPLNCVAVLRSSSCEMCQGYLENRKIFATNANTYSSFTLLDFVGLALEREQDQFGTVLFKTLDVHLQRFDALIPASGVYGNADGTGVMFVQTYTLNNTHKG